MTATISTKTTTAKSKGKLPFPVDMEFNGTGGSTDPIDEAQQRIGMALSSHLATKQSAMEAVAHACVYRHLVDADVDLQSWERDEIEKRNKIIKLHNEQLDNDRKRAEDFMLGRLDKEDAINVPKTEQEKTAAAAEKARLKTIAARTDDEWKTLRKVEIKGREGAGFSTTIKFVFGLDKASDAPTISRYQHVMQWVYSKFWSQFPDSHKPVVQAIEDAHGFEAVLEAQRAKKAPRPPKPANDNADKKAAENEAKALKIRRKVEAEAAKESVKVNLDSSEGLVIVLGRYRKGVFEILRSLNVDPMELDDLLTRYAGNAAHED